MRGSVVSRILLVEDDEMLQVLVRLGVDSSDRAVHAVETMKDAREALEAQDFDAVILDLFLPDGDGRELLAEVRERPRSAQLPVLILSASGGRATQLECFRLGADEFFEKPFDPEILGAAVTRQLERARDASFSSQTDEVTGLLNRAALSECFARLRAASRSDGRPFTVAHLEIDGFDAINGQVAGGKPLGKRVLGAVADALLGNVRPADVVGKWEAGEFVVLFTGAEIPAVRELLEGVQGALQEHSISFSAGLVDGAGAESLRAAVANAGIGAMVERRGRAPGPRILMVEDDEMTSRLVRHRLEREGMEVDHRIRGGDAMELLSRDGAARDYDLVLLDVKLPGTGGFEILEAMRGRAGWKDLPVVMLTGLGREADVVRAFELGADDYMLKPFSPVELLARIHRLLRTG